MKIQNRIQAPKPPAEAPRNPVQPPPKARQVEAPKAPAPEAGKGRKLDIKG